MLYPLVYFGCETELLRPSTNWKLSLQQTEICTTNTYHLTHPCKYPIPSITIRIAAIFELQPASTSICNRSSDFCTRLISFLAYTFSQKSCIMRFVRVLFLAYPGFNFDVPIPSAAALHIPAFLQQHPESSHKVPSGYIQALSHSAPEEPSDSFISVNHRMVLNQAISESHCFCLY